MEKERIFHMAAEEGEDGAGHAATGAGDAGGIVESAGQAEMEEIGARELGGADADDDEGDGADAEDLGK